MSKALHSSALPYAVPISALPGAAWPALPGEAASRLLALQFQFEQSQWWPPEGIEARQFEQLQQVLAHAQRTVPFYGPRLAAAGFDPHWPLDRELWSRIPILTRRDVQLGKEALTSRAIPPEHGKVSEANTSGSTGRAISVLTTEVYGVLWQAITLREHFWHRRNLGSKLAVIRSPARPGSGYPGGLTGTSWGPPADLVYRTGPSAVLDGSATVAQQAEWLTRQDPDVLLTSALRARELALHCRRAGTGLPRLREVRTYGQTLAPDLRAQCHAAWGARVTDMYSSVEIGYMALQCPEHLHYHVQSESVLLEVLDARGLPCREGETGRVVVTSLHNFAMPLIRYEIGDYAEVGGTCGCGRGLPVLARIVGRTRNLLRLPDGSARAPTFMMAKVYDDLPDAQIQIVQTAIDALELRAVPERPLSAHDEARLIEYVLDWAGAPFRVSVRVVDEIPCGPGGKFEDFLSMITEDGPAPGLPSSAPNAPPPAQRSRCASGGPSRGARATPRSMFPGVAWPALTDASTSRLLAIQLQLEQSQWWPPEVIEVRQFEQLTQVVAHAQRTVPFYASRLGALGSGRTIDRERWMQIPLLTREEVQRNKDALLSRAVPLQHGAVGESSSSGSTGRPITVYATGYVTLLWQAFTLREHLWHRRDLAGKLCAIRHQSGGGAMPPDGEKLPGWGPSTDIAYRSGPCSALNIRASIREQADWLAREDPDYLLTYPSNASELLRYLRATGLKLPRLRELRTLSEAIPAALRSLAREVAGVKVVDMYTARETGYIALQCPDHEWYHAQSENLMVEILDDTGRQCAPGETGRVVVTTLHNFATPLIRYDIGDYAQVGAPCPCGRGLPVLERILGRVRNMLVLPNGERHWPNLHADVIHNLAPVLQQQVAQVGPNELEIRLVVVRPLTAAEETAVAAHTCASLRHRFRITFRYLSVIPRGPTGKFEEFVSELEP